MVIEIYAVAVVRKGEKRCQVLLCLAFCSYNGVENKLGDLFEIISIDYLR